MRRAWSSGLLLAAACSPSDPSALLRGASWSSTPTRHFVIGFEDEAARDRHVAQLPGLSPVLPRTQAQSLRHRAGVRSGWRQLDLELLQQAPVPAHWTDADAKRWAQEHRGAEGIRFAVFRGAPPPPPGDIAPTTPDHEGDQGYLLADPGIDAVGAAALGVSGAGVRLSDVEYGWNSAHEELEDIDLHPEPGQTVAAEALRQGFAPEHGTAAIGMIVAEANGFGITGMAPGVQAQTFPEWTEEGGFRRTQAVAAAFASSDPGDVVMLQLQVQDADSGGFGPAELDEDIWMLTKMAVDAGVIVVAAAGNGGLNLDELEAYAQLGDSGAILVGAGDPQLHTTLPFSSIGERVDLQGWGAEVFTTGYGDFAMYGRDPNQAYTASFEGTSAGVPMVAAAAALISEAARDALGVPLAPLDVRRLLVATGTAAGDGEHIGPLPNVTAAIAGLSTAPGDVPLEPLEVDLDPSLDGAVLDASPQDSVAQLDVAVLVQHDAPVYRVVLEATSADDGEVLQWLEESPPFVVEGVELGVGTWSLQATATDAWGAVGISEPLEVTVELEAKGDTGSTTEGGSDSGSSSSAGTGGGTEDDSGSGTGSGCQLGHPREQLLWLSFPLLLLWRQRRRWPS